MEVRIRMQGQSSYGVRLAQGCNGDLVAGDLVAGITLLNYFIRSMDLNVKCIIISIVPATCDKLPIADRVILDLSLCLLFHQTGVTLDLGS